MASEVSPCCADCGRERSDADAATLERLALEIEHDGHFAVEHIDAARGLLALRSIETGRVLVMCAACLMKERW